MCHQASFSSMGTERVRGTAMSLDPAYGDTKKEFAVGFICFPDRALLLFGLSSSL